MLNLKNLKKKIRVIKQLLTADNFSYGVLGQEDWVRGIVADELNKFYVAHNAQAGFQIRNLTDRISSSLLDKAPTAEKFNQTVNSAFSQQMWYFSCVAGYASLWEMKVKWIAEQLGVEVKKPFDERSRKHKNTKMLPLRDLSLIVQDLDKKISKNINFNFKQINELRSAVVHGNLDQLRILANNCQHNFKDEHKGNVFIFDIEKPQEGINLSSRLPQEEREGQRLFSWFIDTTNSQLLREIWDIFDESIIKINALSNFCAYSYGDTKPIFQQIVFEGKKITPDIVTQYNDIFKHHPQFKSSDEFFIHLRAIFGDSLFE